MSISTHAEAVVLLQSLKEQLNDPAHALWLSENPEYLSRINALVSEIRSKLKNRS
jgi:hypothetical protein